MYVYFENNLELSSKLTRRIVLRISLLSNIPYKKYIDNELSCITCIHSFSAIKDTTFLQTDILVDKKLTTFKLSRIKTFDKNLKRTHFNISGLIIVNMKLHCTQCNLKSSLSELLMNYALKHLTS